MLTSLAAALRAPEPLAPCSQPGSCKTRARGAGLVSPEVAVLERKKILSFFKPWREVWYMQMKESMWYVYQELAPCSPIRVGLCVAGSPSPGEGGAQGGVVAQP